MPRHKAVPEIPHSAFHIPHWHCSAFRAAFLLLAGCGDPTIPTRAPAYPFDDALTGDVFRWPASRLPVRLWVDPRGALPRVTRQGVASWEEQFLYGEFRGMIVPESLDADVLVRWTDSVPPDVPPDAGPAVPACAGLTRLSWNASSTLDDYVRITVGVLAGFTAAQVAACVERVSAHELGHALGILRHSADAADLMFPSPQVARPSGGDRRTVEVLYHTAPTVAPRPRS